MQYLVAGELRRSDEPGFQEFLGNLARPRRVHCVCTQPAVEMYVPFVRGQYLLSCMPGTMARHALACTHYEPPLSISGAAAVMGSAIDANESGDITLRLDFAMRKISGNVPPGPSGQGLESAKVNPNKLSMRGLLHYLWQEAGFHKWSPRMEHKRNDWVLHKYLVQAAASKRISAGLLSDVLVVPRPEGSGGQGGTADTHVSLQLARAATDASGARRMALVIGEVVRLSHGTLAHQLAISGLPKALAISDALFSQVERVFSAQIAMWQAGVNRLMVLGTFFNDTVGNPVLSELTLMNVSAELLPFENIFEEALIARLVGAQRRFSKGLRYNLKRSVPIASAVLTDTERPVALFILQPGGDQALLTAQVSQAQSEGLETLVWRAGMDAEPALPPIARFVRTN